MINHDNLEEFRDTEIYDSVNDLNELESKFYCDLADQYGSPVLDIACGTGRLTIPLAKRGHDITGVDITPEMLKAAKKKASDQSVSVNWIHADVRRLELEHKYRMIFTTGNAFQAFLDRKSQDDLLRTVYRHLDENSVFAFETRNPVLSLLSDDKRTVQQLSPFLDRDGKRVTVTRQRSYDHKSQLEHYVITYRRWKNELDVDETIENRIAIRYVFPQELEALLYYNGFTLERMYGDFDLSPFQSDSRLMLCICRKQS